MANSVGTSGDHRTKERRPKLFLKRPDALGNESEVVLVLKPDGGIGKWLQNGLRCTNRSSKHRDGKDLFAGPRHMPAFGTVAFWQEGLSLSYFAKVIWNEAL